MSEDLEANFLSAKDRELFLYVFGENFEAFEICNLRYDSETVLGFIKKVLIYLIMVLDNAKLFLKIKTSSDILMAPEIDSAVSAENEQLIRKKLEQRTSRREQYKLDQGLCKLAIQELIKKVKMKDLMTYIKITRLNFGSNRSNRRAKRKTIKLPRARDGGDNSPKWVGLSVSEHETNEILMAKQKRDDEKLKHAFKMIRKAMKAHFRERMMDEHPDEIGSNKQFREKFDEEVLESNAAYVEAFHQSYITKTNLASLKNCRKFVDWMSDFIEHRFLLKEIRRNVIDKGEEIMKPGLTPREFISFLMTKKKKTGWILQDIINSIELLEDCTRNTSDK